MSDDEQAIRRLIDAWMSASSAGDLATVLRLMADDAVFLVAGQKPFGKAEFIERSNTMRGVQIEGRADIREIEIAPPWAWCRLDVSVTITPTESKAVRRSGPVLTVLRKLPDGRWVIARDANLMTPEV